MIESCRKCPNKSCTVICEDIEKLLGTGKEDDEQEIPISQLTDGEKGSDYDGKTSPINPSELLDKFR